MIQLNESHKNFKGRKEMLQIFLTNKVYNMLGIQKQDWISKLVIVNNKNFQDNQDKVFQTKTHNKKLLQILSNF